ncbi:MAG: alpha/beta hydrolase [Roseovarius sp.]|nr:alpha/beta hydrolase [Roseovarius sp.]MCY4292584.1 alpha/beta hydrolase [Roseovarius sp.]
MMEKAVLYRDMAKGPSGGRAYWLRADDGIRIRMGMWEVENARGTVFALPGFCEYIEKYGIAAGHLAERGYTSISVDWRGQGLADRLTKNRMLGYIGSYSEFQLDLKALLAAARQLNLPRPWFMLAHSMGGCIGLRSLMDATAFSACAFSAPMWGIYLAKAVRPIAWTFSHASRYFGFDKFFTPGDSGSRHVTERSFEDNLLTRDEDMFEYMRRHLIEQPDLKLDGPSWRWLHESLSECRKLDRLPSPDIPCFTIMGTKEMVVDQNCIRNRMERWPNGELLTISGGLHEPLMDSPECRADMFDMISRFLNRHNRQ